MENIILKTGIVTGWNSSESGRPDLKVKTQDCPDKIRMVGKYDIGKKPNAITIQQNIFTCPQKKIAFHMHYQSLLME